MDFEAFSPLKTQCGLISKVNTPKIDLRENKNKYHGIDSIDRLYYSVH